MIEKTHLNTKAHILYYFQVIDTFRFYDEDDYEKKIFSEAVLTREPASFRRENVIAVVILLRVSARMS